MQQSNPSSTTDQFGEDVDYAQPCNGSRCKICSQIVPGPNAQETYTCQSTYVVYKISYGGVNYIGKTTATLSKRMSQHRHAIKAGHGDGEKFIDFYRTHDFNNATITVLDSAENDRELREKEHYWINYYNSYNNGLNSTT